MSQTCTVHKCSCARTTIKKSLSGRPADISSGRLTGDRLTPLTSRLTLSKIHQSHSRLYRSNICHIFVRNMSRFAKTQPLGSNNICKCKKAQDYFHHRFNNCFIVIKIKCKQQRFSYSRGRDGSYIHTKVVNGQFFYVAAGTYRYWDKNIADSPNSPIIKNLRRRNSNSALITMTSFVSIQDSLQS